jgi:hypothetical protein
MVLLLKKWSSLPVEMIEWMCFLWITFMG